MNQLAKEILKDKYIYDIYKLKAEAKERGLESQYPRWITLLMQDLQKRFPEIHAELVDNIPSIKE